MGVTVRSSDRHPRRLRLWFGGGAVALAVLMASTTVASADTTTTTTLPPAPSGFANTLVSYYQAELATVSSLGQGQNLQTVSQYQQSINSFTPTELAQFYSVTQAVPAWSQIPALMQTISATVPTPANQTA